MDELSSRRRSFPSADSMEFYEDTHGALAPDLLGNPGDNVLYAPTSLDDVATIIGYLRTQQNVIVPLTNVEPQWAQRMLDMLAGAAYALGGSVVEVDRERNIFLFAPPNRGITTKI